MSDVRHSTQHLHTELHSAHTASRIGQVEEECLPGEQGRGSRQGWDLTFAHQGDRCRTEQKSINR